MSIEALQQAKSDAVAARARFLDTLGEAQQRLKPGNLASEAWTGVKGKSAEAAGNAVEAVEEAARRGGAGAWRAGAVPGAQADRKRGGGLASSRGGSAAATKTTPEG